MSEKIDTAVVVIGGSLVGLSTAVFLRTVDVPVVVIERHTTSSPHPRAMGFTNRTIELFRGAGLESNLPLPATQSYTKFRRVKVDSLSGKWYEESAWTNPTTTGAASPGSSTKLSAPTDLDGEYPFSPCGGTTIAQDTLEPLLRARALELGADLRLGWNMTSWADNSDGVQVVAEDKSGREITVTGKYLVACDGARSQIRRDLGIEAAGVGPMRKLRSILFRCPSIEHYLDSGYMQFSIKNEVMDGFLTTYRDGRWALMVYLKDSDSSHWDETKQRQMIQCAVGKNHPLKAEDVEFISIGQWDLCAWVSDRFSQGRVFLAGDSAHTFPPTRGGYGANTGIADAHNLAWKLAAVVAGRSGISLLDTYNDERRSVARVRHDQIFVRDDYKDMIDPDSTWARLSVPVLDDVAMELGQLYQSSAIAAAEGDADKHLARRPCEWQGQPGTRAPHLWLIGEQGDKISILDLFGKGWVMLSEDASLARCVDAANATLRVHSGCNFVHVGQNSPMWPPNGTRGAFSEAFGVSETGAVLVRPDGYIAWRSRQSPPVEDFLRALEAVSHVC